MGLAYLDPGGDGRQCNPAKIMGFNFCHLSAVTLRRTLLFRVIGSGLNIVGSCVHDFQQDPRTSVRVCAPNHHVVQPADRARACGASVPQGTGPLLRGAGYGLWFREGAPQGPHGLRCWPHGLRCWPHGLRRELRTSRSLVICPHEDMRANFLVMTAFFECVRILWRTAKRDSSPAEKESGTKCPTAGSE